MRLIRTVVAVGSQVDKVDPKAQHTHRGRLKVLTLAGTRSYDADLVRLGLAGSEALVDELRKVAAHYVQRDVNIV